MALDLEVKFPEGGLDVGDAGLAGHAGDVEGHQADHLLVVPRVGHILQDRVSS